jgi:hypothetical protein
VPGDGNVRGSATRGSNPSRVSKGVDAHWARRGFRPTAAPPNPQLLELRAGRLSKAGNID